MSSLPAEIPAGWESEVKPGKHVRCPSNPLIQTSFYSFYTPPTEQEADEIAPSQLKFRQQAMLRARDNLTVPSSIKPSRSSVFLEHTQTQDGKCTHNGPIPEPLSQLHPQNNNVPHHRTPTFFHFISGLLLESDESCHVNRDGFKLNICSHAINLFMAIIDAVLNFLHFNLICMIA